MTDRDPVLPIDDAHWPEEVAELRDGFAGALNVYRTMAHHPELLKSWTLLREHIVNRSALSRQRLEIVILRTGVHLNSDYEWSQHVTRARHYGLTDDRIRSVRGPVDGMAEEDALLARAVDELFDAARISPATLDKLTDRFGRPAVFDLMATVGFYSSLGFILNTFDTPLDDDIRAELDANPLAP